MHPSYDEKKKEELHTYSTYIINALLVELCKLTCDQMMASSGGGANHLHLHLQLSHRQFPHFIVSNDWPMANIVADYPDIALASTLHLLRFSCIESASCFYFPTPVDFHFVRPPRKDDIFK